MLETVRIILGFVYAAVLLYGVFIMKRNDDREQEIRKEMTKAAIDMKKAATQRSTEAWAKTYDYECLMHNREVAALKQEIDSLNQQVNALEKQLERWEQIGKAVKLGGVRK